MKGVSFIITTLNAGKSLGKCLLSIANQKYPKNKCEVLILDGGSVDDTLKIAKSFSNNFAIKIISVGLKNNQEGRRYYGFKKAKFDYVCILDADNYLGSRNWIMRMLTPLEENKNIVGSFTLHYHYDQKQTNFNRYLALFGGTDPVVYYLGKADRAPWIKYKWSYKKQVVISKKTYTVVRFNQGNFPTLGSNGTVLRKSFVDLSKLSPKTFFHTDILYDLLDQGKNLYAVVDVPLVHDTGSSFFGQLKRRFVYMDIYHLNMLDKRRYHIFNPQEAMDWLKLLGFIIISLTIVIPLLDAIKGYRKRVDKVWFLHPIYCFVYCFVYGLAVIKHWISK